jgi:hypothetical protein
VTDTTQALRDALERLVALHEENRFAAPIDEANGRDTTEREKSAWAAARAALAASPQPAQEPVLWQYRWTNPCSDPAVTVEQRAWHEVKPWNPRMQTLEDRIAELRAHRYNGVLCYEVRALYASPQPAPAVQPTVHQADEWEPRTEVLTDAEINKIADAMPGGLDGFLKGWGWLQFARAIEDAVVHGEHPPPWGSVVESGGSLICASSSAYGSQPLPVGALIYASPPTPSAVQPATVKESLSVETAPSVAPDLGPLPEPACRAAFCVGFGMGYTATQMRAERERCYALGLAAERSKFAVITTPVDSGLSWNGFNLYGDRKSIDEAKRLQHVADNAPIFQQMLLEERSTHTAALEARAAAYNELLFAVSRKHPDETRHETALRYIRQAETANILSAEGARALGAPTTDEGK